MACIRSVALWQIGYANMAFHSAFGRVRKRPDIWPITLERSMARFGDRESLYLLSKIIKDWVKFRQTKATDVTHRDIEVSQSTRENGAITSYLRETWHHLDIQVAAGSRKNSFGKRLERGQP